MTNCDNFHEQISDYIDDELAPIVKHQFEKHIRECSACREVLETTVRMTYNLHELPHFNTSEHFEDRLQSQLDHHINHYVLQFQEWRERLIRAPHLPLLGVLALLLILLFALWNPFTTAEQTQASDAQPASITTTTIH